MANRIAAARALRNINFSDLGDGVESTIHILTMMAREMAPRDQFTTGNLCASSWLDSNDR
jgi:hypothetical protein